MNRYVICASAAQYCFLLWTQVQCTCHLSNPSLSCSLPIGLLCQWNIGPTTIARMLLAPSGCFIIQVSSDSRALQRCDFAQCCLSIQGPTGCTLEAHVS